VSKLVLFLADGGALDIKLDRERLTVGRRPDNDICLPYPAVSGEHAAIVTILNDSFLEDQGSTNGTLVNGRPITKHFLRDRDQIDIGRQRLVYVVDETAVIEAPRSLQINAEGRVLGERVGRVPKATPRVHGTAVPQVEATAAPAQTPAVPPPARRAEPTPSPTAVPVLPPASVPPPAAPVVAVPTLRVLTGANAGRTLALAKDETLVGRAGLQIAALRRTPQGVRLFPVEGERAPVVNGAPAGASGLPVEAGDVIEVAGTQLELLAADVKVAETGSAVPG
jgi:hypothetical protein